MKKMNPANPKRFIILTVLEVMGLLAILGIVITCVVQHCF